MKLAILAAGRARKSPEHELATQWMGRIAHGGEIIEIESRLPAGTGRTRDEGARLLRHLGAGDKLVVCDPAGEDYPSPKLAALIGGWRDQAVPRACFAIGGADGHGTEILARANLRLAFGAATWPHLLFRAMLAEQLYRAEMILSGHPYHRGD